MKQLAYIDLKDLNDNSLSEIIDKWKDYEEETVVLAYSILKKRKSKITESYNYKLVQFMEANSISNINYRTNELLKDRGIPTLSFSEEERLIVSNPADRQKVEVYRYPALIAVSSIYNILSWVIGLIAAGTSLYYMVQKEPNFIYAIISLVSGFIIIIGFLTVSNIIQLLIDLEKNSRSYSTK